MSESQPPNPEQRSDGALLCFAIGAGLVVLSWLLGIGGVLTTALSGGDPAAIAGGIGMLIALPLTAIAGIILAIVGGVWMLARVVADSRDDREEKRYRDIQR
jgi:hypothetical protein